MGQDIPDISQVIRFGAPETPEALKQYFGRAGRDLSTQKKNVRKKQNTTAAAAVDAAQALSTSVPVSTLSDNLPFPVLLADAPDLPKMGFSNVVEELVEMRMEWTLC
ncbi:hypothetical protein R3P38DRAFT_3167862 [Favolaschia claudopus]|uniref:Uncharacterized protein n=1 Tax=Favolaschia claudopus TaxID=2862362 RepID=A0AAW0E4T8_9AGAR